MSPMAGMTPSTARSMMRGIGVSGAVVGIGTILIPRLGLRAVGLENQGRGVGLLARLFGCRDIAMCASLARASFDDRPDPGWLDMIIASQVGDMALTVLMARRGGLSRRGLATIMLTAPPTLVACLLARIALSAEETPA